MNHIKLARHSFLLAAVCCLLTSYAHAALPLVEIKTYGQHIGGKIVYQYQVINNSTCRIPKFFIGYDTDFTDFKLPTTKAEYELGEVLPVGFEHYENDSMPGLYDASSFSGPTNWRADMTRFEGTGSYLYWTADNDINPTIPAGQDIFPGQIARFSVVVPQISQAYVSSHFSAELWSGMCPVAYNSVMQRLDTTPPVLTVTLTPATITTAQRGQMIPVTATITVKDDYDPAPEIKLERIKAIGAVSPTITGVVTGTDVRSFKISVPATNPTNQMNGYVWVFSATDASGNKVQVPVMLPLP